MHEGVSDGNDPVCYANNVLPDPGNIDRRTLAVPERVGLPTVYLGQTCVHLANLGGTRAL